jgi:hypothetical protein
MAIYTSIFVPVGGSTAGSSTADLNGTVTTASSSSEIVLNAYQLFAINANGDINIRFGNAGMPAAAATDFRIPNGVIATYQVPKQWDRMRIFNPGGSTITYWIQPLRQTL